MSHLKSALRSRIAILLSLFVSLLAFSDPGHALQGEWNRIAVKKVDVLADRDVIDLGRADGRFNALRFKSVLGNINIYRIRVTFGNGKFQDLDVNKKLREGEDTGRIGLGRNARQIDKIEMLYASSNLLKRAELEVYGQVQPGSRQRADDDGEQSGDDNTYRTDAPRFVGYEKIGQRFVDLDFDRDRVWIGRDTGLFGNISLRVSGGDIRMRDVNVVYADGSTEKIRVRDRLRDGTQTRGFKLKRRHRGIRRIELNYRRDEESKRAVLVQVYALQVRAVPVEDDDDDLPVSEGDEEGWKVVGARDVDLKTDRDAVSIRRGVGRFSAIALRSREHPLFIYDIRVTFGNGKQKIIRVDEKLRPGRLSKPIDLADRTRRITKVELLYKEDRSQRQAVTVEVLGRTTERRPRLRKDFNDEDGFVKTQAMPRGWARVGRRILHRDSNDGTISPAGEVERFSEIIFRVTGAPIRIQTATIRFRNGETMRLRIKGILRDGDTTASIDLKGRARRIDGIDLKYDPIRGRDKVMVEVIGRKVAP